MHIRAFYGLVMLAGFMNRLFALPSKFKAMGMLNISQPLAEGLRLAGVVVLFGIVIFFALWVLYRFLGSIKILRQEATGKEG